MSPVVRRGKAEWAADLGADDGPAILGLPGGDGG